MFYLFKCDTIPDIGSIPVVKTTEYPASEYGTGPVCQFRFACSDESGVMVDIMAFEREPFVSATHNILSDSSAAICFSFFPDHSKETICAVFNSNGEGGLFSNGKLVENIETTRYAGVDEQGWYWGVRFYITNETLTSKYGKSTFIPGQRILGAAYKFLNGENGHFGSIAPVLEADPFSTENLTEFTVRPY